MDERREFSKVEVDPSLIDQNSSGQDRASAKGTIDSPGSISDGTGSGSRQGSEPRSKRSRTTLGIPIWALVLILLTLIGALQLILDLRNRERYLMVCRDSAMELHRGRRFPWPFGHEVVGGESYRPVTIPPRADCRSRVFTSQAEAEQGFLQFIVARVRAELDLEQGGDLKKAHKHILQALMLSRDNPAVRSSVKTLLAEVDYREGRDSMARVESELRTALARFKEAQQLDGRRYADLKQWIQHLDLLLRSVSPTPGPLPQAKKAESPASPPSGPKATSGTTVQDTKKKQNDAGLPKKTGPDAGIQAKDPGGILL